MQLSVIIVNYNVKYFLEHCLVSVERACASLDAEIIVVDNASADASVAMLQQEFPNVLCIASADNLGFSKANNIGLAHAKGKYILYLNPDTLVPEDCFIKCIDYLEKHPAVGALGPHLIDGTGKFLPESKRGFPGFETAFFKISGLSKIASNSRYFNKYHMGHLPENETNEVDVLAGCFMMMPRAVCDVVGGFSEDYFMYGEDIDLSYCVQKAGFKNVYFADVSVIHFKGESTKKGSMNYVKMFYNAMIIFAKKHLAPGKQKLFIPLVQSAISLRATFSLANKLLSVIWLPLIDVLIMLSSLFLVKYYWATYVKQAANYNTQNIIIFFSTYILTWLSSIYLNGGYDKPLKLNRITRGMAIATLITLAVYGLLPEHVRFSRGITLLGAIIATGGILAARILLRKLGITKVQAATDGTRGILLVGQEADFKPVKAILKEAGVNSDIIGGVASEPITEKENNYLGSIEQLGEIAQMHQSKEIIFVQNALSFAEIIKIIKKHGDALNYKIHSVNRQSIIGSNSKNTAGDLYAADWHFGIATSFSVRNKRLFDIGASLIVLFTFYMHIGKKPSMFKAAMHVLSGKKTWFGYAPMQQEIILPKLKDSVFSILPNKHTTEAAAQQLNKAYAKDYSVYNDWAKFSKILFNKK